MSPQHKPNDDLKYLASIGKRLSQNAKDRFKQLKKSLQSSFFFSRETCESRKVACKASIRIKGYKLLSVSVLVFRCDKMGGLGNGLLNLKNGFISTYSKVKLFKILHALKIKLWPTFNLFDPFPF